jgi:hypothetical protein
MIRHISEVSSLINLLLPNRHAQNTFAQIQFKSASLCEISGSEMKTLLQIPLQFFRTPCIAFRTPYIAFRTPYIAFRTPYIAFVIL